MQCDNEISTPAHLLASPQSVMDKFDERLTFPLTPSETQHAAQKKVERIQSCLMQKPVSLWQLRELALSRGGLVNAEVRKVAWPLLVGLHATIPVEDEEIHVSSGISDEELELIRLDSTRSVLGRYDFFDEDIDDSVEKCSKCTSESLRKVLELTLGRQKTCGSRQYYQGLHDIAGVLLFNLEEYTTASFVLSCLCRSHFRDYLRDDNFQTLLSFLRSFVLPLLHILDPQLHELLCSEARHMLPTILLPWIITWCIHDVSDPEVSSRMVDALICGHSSMIVYIVVAILIQHRDELFQMSAAHDEFPEILLIALKHLSSKTVSDYNTQGVTAQILVDNALSFMHQVPPRNLVRLDRTQGEPLSSFFFKAPPSWALASFPDQETIDLNASSGYRTTTSTYRAKLASGVIYLMKSVPRREKIKEDEKQPQSRTSTWAAFASRIMFRNKNLRAS